MTDQQLTQAAYDILVDYTRIEKPPYTMSCPSCGNRVIDIGGTQDNRLDHAKACRRLRRDVADHPTTA